MKTSTSTYEPQILALTKELQNCCPDNTVLVSDLIKNIRNRYPNIPAEDIPRTLTNLVHDGYLSRPATGLYRLPVH